MFQQRIVEQQQRINQMSQFSQ